MNSIKLIFDCTVLGMGHFHPKAKTGIFRVAETLLYQFASNSTIQLYFYTNEHLIETLCYLHSNKIKIEHKNFHLSKINFYFFDIIAQLLTALPHNSFYQKAIKRIVIKGFSTKFRSVAETSTEEFIFFTPFHPIPTQFRLNPYHPIIVVHDLIPVKFPSLVEQGNIALLKDVTESINHRTDVICVSKSTENDLHEYTQKAFRSTVIPLAASQSLFYQETDSNKIKGVKSDYGIQSDKYFLSVATIEPRKNLKRLIEAFVLFKEKFPSEEIELVLAGTKGWKIEQLFDEIKLTNDLEKQIHFIGFVADHDLAALYSGAFAFVYPSLYEGFGLPVLEAMQCGLPVITSNCSSLPEVAGKAGILVDPTNVASITSAIEKIYFDKEHYESYRKKSIEQVQHFSWKNTMLKYLDIFCQKF